MNYDIYQHATENIEIQSLVFDWTDYLNEGI
jgi:hypothetical protein